MIRFGFLNWVRQKWQMISIVLLLLTVVWVALLIVNNQYKVRASGLYRFRCPRNGTGACAQRKYCHFAAQARAAICHA